ncbi:hypothetical protein TNCT_17281 [Trichonephila clavata]|uniref:Uncharacterized protein n=1 Tax=Trichonephila clavata TaxID=2740835 RepID=A0A8X6FCW7_TRICU|nr:hypothetical protein TNCT_17281 [Trichonephila clavata]
MEQEEALNGLLRGAFFTKEWQHLALFETGLKKEQTMMRKRCEGGKNILSKVQDGTGCMPVKMRYMNRDTFGWECK